MQNQSPALDLLNQNQYVIEIPKLLGCTVMCGRHWPSEYYTDLHTQTSFLHPGSLLPHNILYRKTDIF